MYELYFDIFGHACITEFCASTNLMSTALHFFFMPIDRELAYESLKWTHPKVYRMYLRLRYRGMTTEQIKNEVDSFYKLHIHELVNDALDRMEAQGLVQIMNDYKNEQILLRKTDRLRQ